MRLHILGNNSALPAYQRNPTCQVVELDGICLMLDCGEAAQIQMKKYGVKWRRLNHIFISHLHGDHYFGLFGLLHSMSLLGRTEPLHLFAPAPLEEIIGLTLQVANTVLSYTLHFHALPERESLLVDEPQFSVSTFPVSHKIFCMGFLVTQKSKGKKLLPEKCTEYQIPASFYRQLKAGEDYLRKDGLLVKNEWVTLAGQAPKKYAYCADTLYTESILPYIENADVLYHESTYLESEADRAGLRFHSTARQAATIAQKAGVRRLLLGHYSSKYEETEPFELEARQIFPDTVATKEGYVFDI